MTKENHRVSIGELKQMQSLPLKLKIIKSLKRIEEWINMWDGKVYVSLSGGKDSTVLLDLVRKVYSDVPVVYCDTGLEYPEIKEFVKTFTNITTIAPEMTFNNVLTKYGYPVISKEVSQYIDEYRNTRSEDLKRKRYYGKVSINGNLCGKIPEKWKFLINANFKISNKCCSIMKKKPFALYEKRTGNKMFTGEMADDSMTRNTNYLAYSCNAYKLKRPKSQPLGFWVEQDILQYLSTKGIKYSDIYGDIIKNNTGLQTTKCNRTGCMFCMFGIHMDKGRNRFQRMKETHPKIYEYCMYKLELKHVLEYIGIPYE